MAVIPNEIDVSVECSACGDMLGAKWNPKRDVLEVDPCDKCIDAAIEEAT